jgi:hypothetical protein
MKYFINLLFLCIILNSCANKDQTRKVDKQEYKQHKESLLENEKKSPKEFLTITGTDKRNFWGQTVYRGVIHNAATVCKYKNVRVKLLYYKTDGSLVTNHEEEFDEVVKPGNDIEFKARYKTPRGTDSVVAYIMSAATTEN